MTPTVEPDLAGLWPPAAELVQAELGAYLDAASDPDVAGLATRCSPWTVRDLTAHLAMTFKRFVRMLEQSHPGDLSPPFARGELAAGEPACGRRVHRRPGR